MTTRELCRVGGKGKWPHMMASLRRFLGVISLMVAAWLLPALALSSEQLTVDVFNATINNTAVFGLPLDKLTDMLGRPSAIDDPSTRFPDFPVGPQIHYHHYGLSFWCNNKRKDPEQHCWMMTIYLSRASEKGKSFVPFSGSLIPHLNGNWKLQKVQTELAAYGPKLTTAEEHAARFKAAGVPIESLAEWVEFDRETHTVRLAHDPTTKFLEKIVLESRKEPSS